MQPPDSSSCSKSQCPVFIYICVHTYISLRGIWYMLTQRALAMASCSLHRGFLDTPVIHRHFQCLWQGLSNYHCSSYGLPALCVQGNNHKRTLFQTTSFLIAQDGGVKKKRISLGKTKLVPFVYLSPYRTSLSLKFADGTCWHGEHLLLQI